MRPKPIHLRQPSRTKLSYIKFNNPIPSEKRIQQPNPYKNFTNPILLKQSLTARNHAKHAEPTNTNHTSTNKVSAKIRIKSKHCKINPLVLYNKPPPKNLRQPRSTSKPNQWPTETFQINSRHSHAIVYSGQNSG